MSDLLHRAVQTFGDLVAVQGACSEPIVPGSPTAFEQYTFRFERGALTVAAVGADDSLELMEGGPSLAHVSDLSQREPWCRAIGHGVLWSWLLTNQSGFTDGFQIEFGTGSGMPSGNLSIQLVCEASALTAAMVREVDGQFRAQ